MRVLLIGGSGFIGQRVVARLQQRGHRVVIFHRGQSAPPPPEVATITGNRLEIDKYIEQIEAAAPDAAIDFLPWNDSDTQRVIDTLNGRVEHTVHLSSGDVYRAWGRFLHGGRAEAVPLHEEAPLRTDMYPYQGTRPGMETYDKVLAERAVLRAYYEEGYPGTILRLPMVYGPGDPHYRTWPYVKRMLDGRPYILLGSGEAAWLWQRGYVDDVAFGIVLATERQTCIGQVYNVGSLRTRTIGAWVQAIGDVMGWEGELVYLPDEELPAHLRTTYNYQQHILYDTTKIRRELGYYELTDPAEALQRTVEWQRDHPPDNGSASRLNYEAEDAVLRRLAQQV